MKNKEYRNLSFTGLEVQVMAMGNNKGRPIQSFIQMLERAMLMVIKIILVCVFILLGTLFLRSPGKIESLVDKGGELIPKSISEKVFVIINGVEQGMFIQSKDISHPVLLYLHGGMPEFFLTKNYPTGLENIFTIVWWEQRGSGMSFNPNSPRDAVTVEQLVADTLAITNYLRHRFEKDKIYLMGHSGGTFIGIQAAAQAPDFYYAYLGVEQMSHQLKSEVLAHDYMVKQFKDRGNNRMVHKLEASPVTLTSGVSDGYLKLRDPAMHRLGIGTMHDMHSVITGIFIPSLMSPEYTLREKANLWRAKSMAGVSIVWDEMLTTDLQLLVPELKIPVYFFHGIYDYTCSYLLAKEYFDKLQAPVKGFYTFENSAHSPMFEEPERMLLILRTDVLVGTNNLSD